VVYVEMDTPGAWRLELAEELVQAKLPIQIDGLV
jgi:hypothetical protein